MTASTAACELYVTFLRRSSAFLVEDVEGSEAHVGDFFLAKCDLLIGRIVRRLRDVIGRHCCRRRSAYHRKRQAGCAQSRQSGLDSLI